jgi:tellurite resistance protein TerC
MRKLVIAVIGGTVLLLGIAMIVLPGPAVVVVPAGLAILATQFLWARRALRKGKNAVAHARRKIGWPAFLRRKPRPASTASTTTVPDQNSRSHPR